jgi:hypothetical protein
MTRIFKGVRRSLRDDTDAKRENLAYPHPPPAATPSP